MYTVNDSKNLVVDTNQLESQEQVSKTPDEKLKNLASELKLLCDPKGIEDTPAKSAEIIHKIGMEHFRLSPDKISLIKSVGLLNSAIARNPNNVEKIKQNLFEICQHILQQADAQDQTADLLAQADTIKLQIESMRKKTKEALKSMKETQLQTVSTSEMKNQEIHKIDSMKRIQQQIAEQYKEIMINISSYCVKVMGQPPCKFAIVGMGSLARREITPYSDFEHIILLECQENYEKHLDYFRWFSVIFHVIILNLKETIIPSLNVKYLNDKSVDLGDWFFDIHRSGVSFDGMMPHACKFPLGNTQTVGMPSTTELIKPVDKMLEYLSCKDSFINDYHLSDILMQTCFVYGNQSLHNQFQDGIVEQKANKSKNQTLTDIRHQVKEDFKAFAKRIKLESMNQKGTINIKQLFYRTCTLFVTALGKIFETESSSCFDIINELAQKEKITDDAKDKLMYAVAIACEIRLRVYMKAESQRDYITAGENAKTVFDEILKIIDKESILSYFQITYCLHRKIINVLGSKLTHFYKDGSLFNITILYALKQDEMMLSLLLKYNIFGAISFRQDVASNETCCVLFDKDLARLEKETDFKTKMPSQQELLSLFRNLSDIALTLLFTKLKMRDALDILKCVLEVCQRLTEVGHKLLQNEEVDENIFLICYLNMLIASYLVEFDELDEALEYINQSFDVQSSNPKYTFAFYLLAGNNWFKMKQYEKSLHCLSIALGIRLSVKLDFYDHLNDYLIAMIYSGIGTCFLKLDQYEESLIYLNTAVQMTQDHKLEEDRFSTFAFTPATARINLEMCLQKL